MGIDRLPEKGLIPAPTRTKPVPSKRFDMTRPASAILSFMALATPLTARAVDFEKDVLPVLEERCMSCHRATYTDPKTGRKKKAKSGYRMDTAELLLGGGDENDANIVAGKPDQSPFYTYTTLPEDDDWAMPTKGDRLTPEQQDAIKDWIAAGADLGGWQESTFDDAGNKIQ